jgi:glycosyltransferase involved in cell wall biosynthesis
MASNHFPKVLILIQPFNMISGGGITLTNLFRGWPKDKIAVACRGYVINRQTQTDICDNYYQLGEKELKWKFPFNHIRRKYYSGPLDFSKKGEVQIVSNKSKKRVNFSKNYFDPFLRYTGLANMNSSIELSPQFVEWIKEFDPDIIYAQSQGRATTLFCTKVQQHLGKPMVFHMMDDWPELIQERSLFGAYWHKKIDNELKDMLDHCSLFLAISDTMAMEYKKRYQRDFLTFHNPIDVQFWKKGQRKDWSLSDTATVLYAGRMGLGIQKSLKTMAGVIESLNKKGGQKIKFVLQVSEKVDWMEKYQCVEHRAFVPYEELPHKFGEADILFLPYDFSVQSIKFIKYSMPTKASEYMASGTPILIYSPEQTAVVEYAKSHHWAEVVTEEDPQALKRGLLGLLKNQSKREEIAKAATKLAETKHDSKKVRREFQELIIELNRNNQREHTTKGKEAIHQ